ncbi:hypothetical protein [Chitinophaga silvisoli]|uniref:Uncharacterized protein n=1 Tax=Chitinophaga silvisoli TaxID=2291814 RepID=A0A3E1P0F3_9BACT|nr:hypothetical protein [Chitinophaga silvisoli]RFM33652.1 hypothetical protein DXN04_16965 [Chitinophaga silvisoli]
MNESSPNASGSSTDYAADVSNIARKQYLNIAKRRTKAKEIRRGIPQQLPYVKRDLKYVNWLIETDATFKETLKWKE